MNIVVCIKQVPETLDVKISPKTNNLDREGIVGIMNPYDKNAIEEAVRIKKEIGGTVTAISMGPENTVSILREALAMGADKAILVSDIAFAGSDTWATSQILKTAIERNKDGYDLIICGKEAIDADTGQVGPGIAERMNMPQITFVEEIIDISKEVIRVKRKVESGYEVIETKLPALITVTDKINKPGYLRPISIMKAAKKEIIKWGNDTLKISPEKIGQIGSPTIVRRLYNNNSESKALLFKGDEKESSRQLINELLSQKIL